jgi:hypothetical protein
MAGSGTWAEANWGRSKGKFDDSFMMILSASLDYKF